LQISPRGRDSSLSLATHDLWLVATLGLAVLVRGRRLMCLGLPAEGLRRPPAPNRPACPGERRGGAERVA